MNRHGILIIGHGTPTAEGTRAFLEIVKLAQSMAGETPIAAGFMEFASPTIADALADLHRRGVTSVAAVPVFLSGAGHTAEDIPQAVFGLREQYPPMNIELTAHVGSHPKIVELSAVRYHESLAGRASIAAKETLAILAAHGSPEPEAIEELERFAAARESIAPAGRVVPCFSQMGSPLLRNVLPELMRSLNGAMRRIVVQPHFILKGRLVDAIVRTSAAVAEEYPEVEFVVAEPLGSHRLLAEAILELGSRRA